MEIPTWMSRTELLIGDEKVKKLMTANVLVVGLGGVGGICAEMIARSGVGSLTIVDGDVIEASNRNRQIVATKSVEGLSKAEVLANRLRDINPELKLTVYHDYIKDEKVDELLQSQQFDMAVDCIDTLAPKVFFLKHCVENGIKVVSSLGAGGKLDPSAIEVSDISKSHNCRLAKYVRKRLHKFKITKGIKVVFSPEEIDKSKVYEVEGGPKKSVIGTISYMPAIFGCTVASVVIRELIGD